MSVISQSATQLKQLLQKREISSVELVRAYLDQIEQHDTTIGSFLSIRPEQALQHAQQIDERRKNNDSLGILAGIPVAVKDLLCVQHEPTTCASRMLQEFKPPYNATVIEQIAKHDGILIGKTNLDEFAMGGSTENSSLGKTCNPWDLTRVPGGSSGGAAAAVAAKMAPLSIGTDTGGSIRQPAAYCGVVGLKPTYGRVSRFGLIAFASSLDQIGPLAGSVEDAALLLEAIAGHDPKDSTSANRDTASYSATVGQSIEGMRIGVPSEFFKEGLDPEVESSVKEALRIYESMGASIKEVSLPHNRYGIAAYYIIAPSEASSNLARYDGVHYGYRTNESEMLEELAAEQSQLKEAGKTKELQNLDGPLVRMYRKSRSEAFGDEVKRRIMLGAYALSAGYYDAYYLKALKVRRLIRNDYDKAFEEVDFIAGPVTPTPAFPIGAMNNDPLTMYLQDLFTVGANLAGITSISIPCGFTKNQLPIGLQLQAAPFEEERLLQAANMFQTATDWHLKRPELA